MWERFDDWLARYEHLDVARVDNGSGPEPVYWPMPDLAHLLHEPTTGSFHGLRVG